MEDRSTIANNIYNQALAGSPVNPGLPDPLAALLVLQAAHETNGFISNVFLQDNNAFGYKYVGSRYQTGPGLRSPEGDHYGHYSGFPYSVQELVDWLYRRRSEGKIPPLENIRDIDTYAKALKNTGYYGDTLVNYTAGLRRWEDLVEIPETGGISLISIVLVAALVWGLKKLA